MKIGETVEKEIQRRQLIWYGHAKRMEGETIPRVSMQYKQTCKKEKERPRKINILKQDIY